MNDDSTVSADSIERVRARLATARRRDRWRNGAVVVLSFVLLIGWAAGIDGTAFRLTIVLLILILGLIPKWTQPSVDEVIDELREVRSGRPRSDAEPPRPLRDSASDAFFSQAVEFVSRRLRGDR